MKKQAEEVNILQLLENTLNAAKDDVAAARGKQAILIDLIEFFKQPGVKVTREVEVPDEKPAEEKK